MRPAPQPFSTNPSPASLHRTAVMNATMARIQRVVDGAQGLAVLSGEVGMGKSSMLRLLHAEYLATEDVVAVLVPSPISPRPFGLLKIICEELQVPPARALEAQLRLLKGYLLELHAARQYVTVFMDEAQMLDNPRLELIRVLLNFETDQAKLINFVLAGQPDLWERIRNKRNRAIHSRVMVHNILEPLGLDEVSGMIQVRCDHYEVQNPFRPSALQRIHELSEGVPRRALMIAGAAYDARPTPQTMIDAAMIDAALQGVMAERTVAHGAA